MLNSERITLIRTAGKTDTYWSRLWRIPRAQIRLARIGETFADHPVPPDTRPRNSGGRYASIEARIRPATEKAIIGRAIASMKPPCVVCPQLVSGTVDAKASEAVVGSIPTTTRFPFPTTEKP